MTKNSFQAEIINNYYGSNISTYNDYKRHNENSNLTEQERQKLYQAMIIESRQKPITKNKDCNWCNII